MSPGGSQSSQEGIQRGADDQLPRRLACDRCRAHKLRCLRDDRTTDALQPCQRCSKAGATCTTGTSLRSGRPSKSAREKQISNSNSGTLRSVGHLQSEVQCLQSQSALSSGSSQSHEVVAKDSSPVWLVEWENMLQPSALQISSGDSNESPDQIYSGSGTSSFQDQNSVVDGFNVNTAIQDPSNPGADALDFGSLLDLTQMNDLGLSQDDAMDIEVEGCRTPHLPNSELDTDVFRDNSASAPLGSIAVGVQGEAELPCTHLEIADLKEEILRRLADLHSGLLADLNLTRSVGKGPCRATSRVSLASSQRNADGKIEEYNFLVGRMLGRSEIFLSILRYFTPSTPEQSSHGSRSESERSDDDQDIMDAFTSWNNHASPSGSEQNFLQFSENSTSSSRGIIRCDVPMTLSILTCYVCLTRIYRTIFSNMHAGLLAAREGKLELPPLFPGLKLGGFAPHMNLQVHILVQLSTNLLSKIDDALGLPDEHGRTKKGGGILARTGSVDLLQTMMKEEAVKRLDNGDQNGASLRDIMRSITILC